MFTNFNFAGLSQLADLNINEKLQQIKNDLEANLENSLGIDHAALAALTGESHRGGSRLAQGRRYILDSLAQKHYNRS